jgi:hypothetical protein
MEAFRVVASLDRKRLEADFGAEGISIRGVFDEETSQDGVNRSRCARRGLHCELSNYNAEPQADKEPVL